MLLILSGCLVFFNNRPWLYISLVNHLLTSVRDFACGYSFCVDLTRRARLLSVYTKANSGWNAAVIPTTAKQTKHLVAA